MAQQFQRVGTRVATGAVKGITLVSSGFSKVPGAPAEGSRWPVKKSRGVRGGQLTSKCRSLANDSFKASL